LFQFRFSFVSVLFQLCGQFYAQSLLRIGWGTVTAESAKKRDNVIAR